MKKLGGSAANLIFLCQVTAAVVTAETNKLMDHFKLKSDSQSYLFVTKLDTSASRLTSGSDWKCTSEYKRKPAGYTSSRSPVLGICFLQLLLKLDPVYESFKITYVVVQHHQYLLKYIKRDREKDKNWHNAQTNINVVLK